MTRQDEAGGYDPTGMVRLKARALLIVYLQMRARSERTAALYRLRWWARGTPAWGAEGSE